MTPTLKRRPHIADADYYRLGYQLAAQLMNRAAAPELVEPARPSGAPEIVNDDPLALARQLLDDAATVRAWFDGRRDSWMRWRWPAPHEDRLQTFLAATIEPCCALIAARALHQLGRPGEADPLVAGVLRRAVRGELSYRAYYALACLEAADGDDDDAIRYLSHALYAAPRARRAELVEWAQSDPAFASLRAAVRALVAPEAPPEATDERVLDADIASLERAIDELRDRPLDATAARVQLASALQCAKRTSEAVALDARVAADVEELLGADHAAAVAARAVLMRSRKLLNGSSDAPAIARRVLELRDALVQALADSGA